MFNYEYLKFIYAFKEIFDKDDNHAILNKIKDEIYGLIFTMGYKPMSRIMFDELLSLLLDDEDHVIREENKMLAFILNLTETDIYRTDFNNYFLLNNNIEHTYDLLYKNQMPELNNVFRDENNNMQFFYCPNKMLDIFIENKIITLKPVGVTLH